MDLSKIGKKPVEVKEKPVEVIPEIVSEPVKRPSRSNSAQRYGGMEEQLKGIGRKPLEVKENLSVEEIILELQSRQSIFDTVKTDVPKEWIAAIEEKEPCQEQSWCTDFDDEYDTDPILVVESSPTQEYVVHHTEMTYLRVLMGVKRVVISEDVATIQMLCKNYGALLDMNQIADDCSPATLKTLIQNYSSLIARELDAGFDAL